MVMAPLPLSCTPSTTIINHPLETPSWPMMAGLICMVPPLRGKRRAARRSRTRPAFCQANPRAFSHLLADVGGALEEEGVMPTALIDLHAGAGAVGFALAARAGGPGGVTAVDVNPAGAAPFAASAARLQEEARAVGRDPPTLTFQATAAGAAAAGGVLALGDGAVVDPPRKGLEPALCRLLATSPPPSLHTLVYISCHFPSLARDGDTILAAGRWALRASAARVFFPGSDAVEAAAVFVRR